MRKKITRSRFWMESPLVVERTNLINKVIKEVLNESFESVIDTEYEIINDVYDNLPLTIYRFKTNSGHSYDLELFNTLVSSELEVDGIKLKDHQETEYKNNVPFLTTVDLAFVPSEINMDDRDNHELYTKETERDEVFELMGRISFLIKNFIEKHPNQNIFVIGKNTKEIKLKVYLQVFNNIFSEEFITTEGTNPNYMEGSFYFIKK